MNILLSLIAALVLYPFTTTANEPIKFENVSGHGITLNTKDNSDYAKFDRVNWQSKSYYNYKNDIKKDVIGQSHLKKYGTFWPVTNTPNTQTTIDAQLPYTGSILYNNNFYGTDFLRTNIANNAVNYSKQFTDDPNESLQKQSDLSDFTSTANLSSNLNLGLDFGVNLNLTQLPGTIAPGNPGFQLESSSFNENYVETKYNPFSNFKLNNFYHHDSYNNLPTKYQDQKNNYLNCDLTVPDNFKSKSIAYDPKNPIFNDNYPAVNRNTFAPMIMNPSQLFINENENNFQQYIIGCFGLHIINPSDPSNSTFLTFIYKTDVKNNIDNNNANQNFFSQQHLIIDQNNSQTSQQNELNQIFNVVNNLNPNTSSEQEYTTSQKNDLINKINGFNTNSGSNLWNVDKRVAISLLSTSNVKDYSNPDYNYLPINSDKKIDNNPSYPYEQGGYFLNNFTNIAIEQNWSATSGGSDNPFYQESNNNIIYGFHIRFSKKDGYRRDRSINPIERQHYWPPNYPVFDTLFPYTIKFLYDTHYNYDGNYWSIDNNIGNQTSYQFTTLNNYSETQVKPMENYDFSTTSDIKPIYYSNKKLEPGAIVAIVITGIIILPGVIYVWWTLNQARKKLKKSK